MSHFSSQRQGHKQRYCPRCSRRLHRHGERRWYCPRCHRAFRFHHKRRGPKRRLRTLRPLTVRRFLAGRHSVRSLQERGQRSLGATHRRLRRGLCQLARGLLRPPLPAFGGVIIVADALWLRIRGRRVTVYVILVRPVWSDTAVVAVVLPREEWECEAGWRAALLELPPTLRRCVRGASVDEHAGLTRALRDLCGEPGEDLPIQWCQFHCLAEFLRKLGRKTVKRDPVTAAVWGLVRRMLREPRASARRRLIHQLQRLARRRVCPPRTVRAVHWFLARIPRVTVTFRYPRRRLPTTTGSAESSCNLLRTLFRRVRPRSMDALETACAIFLRLHPTIQCTSKSHRNR